MRVIATLYLVLVNLLKEKSANIVLVDEYKKILQQYVRYVVEKDIRYIGQIRDQSKTYKNQKLIKLSLILNYLRLMDLDYTLKEMVSFLILLLV